MTKATDFNKNADNTFGITDHLKKLYELARIVSLKGEYQIETQQILTAAEITNLEAEAMILTTVDAMTTRISWA